MHAFLRLSTQHDAPSSSPKKKPRSCKRFAPAPKLASPRRRQKSSTASKALHANCTSCASHASDLVLRYPRPNTVQNLRCLNSAARKRKSNEHRCPPHEAAPLAAATCRSSASSRSCARPPRCSGKTRPELLQKRSATDPSRACPLKRRLSSRSSLQRHPKLCAQQTKHRSRNASRSRKRQRPRSNARWKLHARASSASTPKAKRRKKKKSKNNNKTFFF